MIVQCLQNLCKNRLALKHWCYAGILNYQKQFDCKSYWSMSIRQPKTTKGTISREGKSKRKWKGRIFENRYSFSPSLCFFCNYHHSFNEQFKLIYIITMNWILNLHLVLSTQLLQINNVHLVFDFHAGLEGRRFLVKLKHGSDLCELYVIPIPEEKSKV